MQLVRRVVVLGTMPVLVGATLVPAVALGRPDGVGAATAAQVVAIRDLATHPRYLPAVGGRPTVTAKVLGASKCRLTSSPRVHGTPVTSSCASGRFSARIRIGKDHRAVARRFHLTLRATGKHGSVRRRLTVTEYPIPSLSSVKVSPSSTDQYGGQVLIEATVKQATHCTVKQVPSAGTSPATLPCTNGKIGLPLDLPQNLDRGPVAEGFTVTATGRGGSVTSALTHVTESGSTCACQSQHGVISAVNVVPTGCAAGCEGAYDTVDCSASRCLEGGSGDGVGDLGGAGDPAGIGYIQLGEGATAVQEPLPNRPAYPYDTGGISGISCAAGQCHATALVYNPTTHAVRTGFLTSEGDGADGWTQRTLPAADGAGALSCSSAARCVAVGSTVRAVDGHNLGQIYLTTNGGKSWTSEEAPSGTADFQSVSCPSTSECLATAINVRETAALMYRSVDGGRHWSEVKVPRSAFPGGVTCPTAFTCYAAGGSVIVSHNGGASWSTVLGPDAGVASIGCSSAVTCEAAEGLQGRVLATTNAGATWSYQDVVPIDSDIDAIGCTTGLDCVGGGDIEDPANQENFDPTVFSNTEQSPLGGIITLIELLGGGFNPCTECLLHAVANSAQPVDSETGNFWHSFQDISIPGRGIPLSLTRTYNARAASTDSPFGYGWSYTYGVSLTGNGSTLDDSAQVTLRQENGSGEIFTAPQHQNAPFSYGAPPRVQATLVQNTDGTFTLTRDASQTLTFNAQGQLQNEVFRDGSTTSLSYSGNQLASVTDPAGRTISFGWTGDRITSATDPMGRAYTYGYDANGNLTSVTDPAGNVTHFSYDTVHRMLSMTSPDGGTTTNVYDSSGRVVKQTDPTGGVTTWAYWGNPTTQCGEQTTVTDPDGDVTQYYYSYGVLISKVAGAGTSAPASWFYLHDPATLGTTATVDPDGDGTYQTFDANGNVLTSTDALGNTTAKTYDRFNQPSSEIDPMGVKTTWSYDSDGNLLSKTVNAGRSSAATTSYAYGDANHPSDQTSMTDPNGNTWTYSYDHDGDKTTTTDPDADTTTAGFNTDGEQTSATDADGNKTIYTYTPDRQVHTTTDPLDATTTRTYDADNNLVTSTDPDGNTSTYSYNANDQVTAAHSPDAATVTTGYDKDGNVISRTDGGGHTTTYTFNPLGQQTSVTDPDGHVTHFVDDGDGHLLKKTDPLGTVTTYRYDADGNRTAKNYSDGTPAVTLAYDADNRRTSMNDGSGTWTWAYNPLGEITSVQEGSGSNVVDYGYDLDGHITSTTYPDGNEATMSYDPAGRETAITDWLGAGNTTSFGYDPAGNLTTVTFPKGTGPAADTDTFSYDADNRVTSAIDSNGTDTLFSATYTRDADGNMTGDSSQPASADGFGYDPGGRLCYAGSASSGSCGSPPTDASTYAYDTADDPTTLAHPAASSEQTQAFDLADELCWSAPTTSSAGCASPPSGATVYTHDADGDLTAITPPTGPATTLTYDAENRLTTYSDGSTSASYVYNSDGLRMSTTVNGTTNAQAWNTVASVPELITDGTDDYLYGPGGLPVEQVAAGVPSYYHHDAAGSTRLLTGGDGAVVASYDYDPYGATTAATGSAAASNPFRYDGQYEDAATGLYYLRARYYDPATAQFLTVDPMAASTGTPYAYASDNPLDEADPSGQDICLFGQCVEIDNPFTSLSQDVQNFDQNIAILDSTPFGEILNFDPFFAAARDSILSAQGIALPYGSSLSGDLVGALTLFAPGAGDALGAAAGLGYDALYDKGLSSYSGEAVSSFLDQHPWIVMNFSNATGGPVNDAITDALNQLFPNGTPAQDRALLQQQCGF